jgi:hypothetical protein
METELMMMCERLSPNPFKEGYFSELFCRTYEILCTAVHRHSVTMK